MAEVETTNSKRGLPFPRWTDFRDKKSPSINSTEGDSLQATQADKL